LTGHFTPPVSSRALIASCVIDVGVAAMRLAVAQYQDAATSPSTPSREVAFNE